MIIKLKGADFSANNINSLLNSWPITFYGRTLVTGTFVSSVSKGSTYTATFSVAENCTVDSVTITRGGTTISGATISGSTISISVPTTAESGPISITFNGSAGEEDGGTTAFINVFNPDDPDVVWGQAPTSASSTGSLTVTSGAGTSGYIAVKSGDIIRGGTYRTTTNSDGTNYYPFKAAAIYWYDANKNFLKSTTNPTFTAKYYTNDFICEVPTTPANIAYFRVYLNGTYKDTTIITINQIAPTTLIPYGDTTTPSNRIPQGSAIDNGSGDSGSGDSGSGDSGSGDSGTTGNTTLEGVVSSPSSTVNVFNPADANTTKTLSTNAEDGEVYKVQSERGTSGFIAVKAGDILRQATFREGSTSADTGTSCYPAKSSPIYYYDKDLKYISRAEGYAKDGTNKDWRAIVPSDSNIAYMRTMINTTYINSTIITINNSIDTFVAYQAAN